MLFSAESLIKELRVTAHYPMKPIITLVHSRSKSILLLGSLMFLDVKLTYSLIGDATQQQHCIQALLLYKLL